MSRHPGMVRSEDRVEYEAGGYKLSPDVLALNPELANKPGAVPSSKEKAVRKKSGMSEETLLDCIIELALATHWRPAHIRGVRVQRKDGSIYYQTPMQPKEAIGFPDLILVKKRIIWIECKSDTGQLSPEQIVWRIALEAAGAEYYLWKPADWVSGKIEKVLMAGK